LAGALEANGGRRIDAGACHVQLAGTAPVITIEGYVVHDGNQVRVDGTAVRQRGGWNWRDADARRQSRQNMGDAEA